MFLDCFLVINSRLSRHSTGRGSSIGLVPVGIAKVKAPEGTPEVKIIKTLGVLIVHTRFDIEAAIGHPAPCYFNNVKLFLILSDQYHSPEWDLNLGPSWIAVFEHCKTPALSTRPSRLDF